MIIYWYLVIWALILIVVAVCFFLMRRYYISPGTAHTAHRPGHIDKQRWQSAHVLHLAAHRVV